MTDWDVHAGCRPVKGWYGVILILASVTTCGWIATLLYQIIQGIE